jgi:hypothetical protein
MNIVTHIELRAPGNRRSGIQKIHGETNGSRWSYTEAQAIRMILGLDGTAYTFWARGMSSSLARVVVAGTSPHLFLKTEADGIGANNLLALPEWPYAA